MSVITVTNEEQLNAILSENENVVLDFYATWCGPCKQLSPVLDEISSEQSNVKICKINVEDESVAEIVSSRGIRSIPTLEYYKGGKVIHTAKGFLPKNQLLSEMSLKFGL